MEAIQKVNPNIKTVRNEPLKDSMGISTKAIP